MKRFENRSAVITGGSSGVGKAIALALAAEGASMAIVGRDPQKLDSVVDEATKAGGRAQAFTSEFCEEASVQHLGLELARRFPRLDYLVHSAGVIKLASFAEASLADFDTHYRCNVRAPFALTQQLLPSLKATQGSVVFINSTAVENSRAGISQYAATKHALKGVADSLRDEVNRDGLRVLSVFLGRTATPMQELVHRMEGKPRYEPGRFIQPQDVATLVLNALGSPPTVELTNVYLRPALPPA